MLQVLNLLGILSENNGKNITGGAFQALNLPGFTFRNQPFWNYGLIHLASLTSPANCITLMPLPEEKKGEEKKKERERFQLSEDTEGKFSNSPWKLKQKKGGGLFHDFANV